LPRVERADFRLPVVINTSIIRVLRRPVESAQYLSIRYTERLADAGIDTSVGSVGDSYDNALAESVIGLFKTEVIEFFGSWKSVGHVEWETLQWVSWYNTERLHGAIGHRPPQEMEDAFYASLNALDNAA
jgi:putative transposase